MKKLPKKMPKKAVADATKAKTTPILDRQYASVAKEARVGGIRYELYHPPRGGDKLRSQFNLSQMKADGQTRDSVDASGKKHLVVDKSKKKVR